MTHKTFKVSIVLDELIENFYIKHYVDDYQPILNKFKNLVFQRNPSVNSPLLKIFWIDAENDKILISCEEDFRLYIEQGQGKKIFFSVITGQQQQQRAEEEDEVAMEAEESHDNQKDVRKSRKSAREDEKQKRAAKRLAEKMRNAEDKVRSEEERYSRHPEKHERKNAERLERAKKRCEQIRQIIGSMDPANLNTSRDSACNVGASTSAQSSADPSLAVLHPSPETIRLLSNAIAGCLQPCSLINKILNEIIGMVPHPTEEGAAQQEPAQMSFDQQQQTEVSRQNTATNTSDLNTPMSVSGHPSSQEIEALFKEAAKELEKMNEIVNSSKPMEGTSGSMASSMTGITQVERVFANFTDSAISNATIINNEAPDYDDVDARAKSPEVEDDFKMVTPPKSTRSRESSIEVHDVNSMMSDDSRDWTMLDAIANEQEETSVTIEQEEVSIPSSSRAINPETGAVPKAIYNPFHVESEAEKVAENKKESIKSIETQTPTSVEIQAPTSTLSNASAISGTSQAEVKASIQKSIETVGKMNEIVKNSVASAQQSLKSMETPIQVVQPAKVVTMSPLTPAAPTVAQVNAQRLQHFLQTEASSRPVQITTPSIQTPTAPPTPAVRQPTMTISIPTASSAANAMANRTSMPAKWTPPKAGPAVIVYDPNPKINAAVHTMINMGFSNEGGWLTQLLVNVDGDVPQAINFLTPQPKNKPQ